MPRPHALFHAASPTFHAAVLGASATMDRQLCVSVLKFIRSRKNGSEEDENCDVAADLLRYVSLLRVAPCHSFGLGLAPAPPVGLTRNPLGVVHYGKRGRRVFGLSEEEALRPQAHDLQTIYEAGIAALVRVCLLGGLAVRSQRHAHRFAIHVACGVRGSAYRV